MLFVVAETFAQLGWSFFRNPRLLEYLHRMERASHGTRGSLQLLLRELKSAAVILVAVIVIASIAIGPFVQQAIKNIRLPAGQFLVSTDLRTDLPRGRS
jgi:hypothetical protein